VVIPSEILNKIWSAHILDTRKYVKHCKEIFGGYYHHSVTYGQPSERLIRSYLNTLLCYTQQFKQDPPTDIWPPTFQITLPFQGLKPNDPPELRKKKSQDDLTIPLTTVSSKDFILTEHRKPSQSFIEPRPGYHSNYVPTSSSSLPSPSMSSSSSTSTATASSPVSLLPKPSSHRRSQSTPFHGSTQDNSASSAASSSVSSSSSSSASPSGSPGRRSTPRLVSFRALFSTGNKNKNKNSPTDPLSGPNKPPTLISSHSAPYSQQQRTTYYQPPLSSSSILTEQEIDHELAKERYRMSMALNKIYARYPQFELNYLA